MQLLLLPMNNSTGLLPSVPVSLEGKSSKVLKNNAYRSGALTATAVDAEHLHQLFKGVKIELPGGYNMMDVTSRLNVFANNILRILQAWGWDFAIGDYRIFQAAQHKWETTTRDIGNNVLNSSLIGLVKGEFLSNLFIDGLVKASYTSQPQAYSQKDNPWQRIQKVWHNTVRHPFRQTFGLSAHPLTTIGHVLPPKERHWLVIKPLDTNILLLKRFGDALSLKTTFDAIQEAILATEHPAYLLDTVRKAGTRLELKKLYVSLVPNETIKPQVMDALSALFEEKTGALKPNAFELAPKVQADIQYFLTLYKPCGGYSASDEGVQKLLRQVLATEDVTVISDKGLLAVKTAKQRAMLQAGNWFKAINTNWKNDADQAVRASTQVILAELTTLSNQEHDKAVLAGKTTICKQTLAKRFALEVAPKLMSKTGNTFNGELATILEPALQLSQRTALLNEYESHRNTALLSQTITQALFTCFVLGNLLFFIVFNTLARLDVDFKGPHGETRLDFGELKRKLVRWIKKQLGQEVEEPKERVLQPKISLDLSLGNNLTLKKEQQLFNNGFNSAMNNAITTTSVINQPLLIPVSNPMLSSSYLNQAVEFNSPSYLKASLPFFASPVAGGV